MAGRLAIDFDQATMPVLWLSWPGDKHFPMEILKKSYDQCGSENMVSLVPNMGHGHGPAWSRPESYAFAKSVLENGTIVVRKTGIWSSQKSIICQIQN